MLGRPRGAHLAGVNTSMVLDLIAAREATAAAPYHDLGEQLAKLSNELATLDADIMDLQITRQISMKLGTTSSRRHGSLRSLWARPWTEQAGRGDACLLRSRARQQSDRIDIRLRE
jgi:hypothetical protein